MKILLSLWTWHGHRGKKAKACNVVTNDEFPFQLQIIRPYRRSSCSVEIIRISQAIVEMTIGLLSFSHVMPLLSNYVFDFPKGLEIFFWVEWLLDSQKIIRSSLLAVTSRKMFVPVGFRELFAARLLSLTLHNKKAESTRTLIKVNRFQCAHPLRLFIIIVN